MTMPAATGRPAHSLLFVPGDRPERFDKALASGAQGVVLDLEDAVAPAAKAEARTTVQRWLAPGRHAWVRCNAADTPWFDDDLQALAGLPQAGLMLPKAEPAALARVARALPGRPLIALVETVAGWWDLRAVAQAPGVQRLAFGSVDFAAESGIVDVGEALTAVRTQLVLASCAAGLAAPLDGVSLVLDDAARLQAEAQRSRQLGFGGKLCIHPRQVQAVNAAFRPGADELAWARRVLVAFEASAGGVTVVDGRMVDRPVVLRAQRLLAEGSLAGAAVAQPPAGATGSPMPAA